MLVIPVIDLLDGAVVHARRGDRASYQPIQSKLTPSSAPLAVVAALTAFAPFRQLYIADLDAIQKRGSHRHTIAQLTQQFPQLEFWIDAGLGSVEDVTDWMQLPIRLIVGSESLPNVATWRAIRALMPHAILSLDTRGQVQMGPEELFESSADWPSDVIVMTLDRVGSGQGPATDRIATAHRLSPAAHLIAAGGVRNSADLENLEKLNVHAALIATAIHDGRLDAVSLRRFLPA